MINLKTKGAESFPPLLHLTYDLQQLSDKNLTPKAGIGLGQVRILGGLHNSVPRSQKELAFSLHQTEANISRQLQLLKKQRLVTVTKNKKDSRQRDVKLTTKGTQKYKLAVKILDSQQKGLLKGISIKEQKTFQKTTEHIAGSLGSGLKYHRKILK